MYDLKELETFDAVVRGGGLGIAARELNLPKSTLSRHIRKLEEGVGQSLLRREANHLVPNESGQLFHRYCQQMLSLAHEGQEALREIQGRIAGELVLSAHEAFIRGWFSQVIQGFMGDYPELRVTLRTQTEPPGSETDGICIWLGSPGETHLRQEPLGALTQGIYGHPDYLDARGRPASPEELLDHTWIDLLGTAGEQEELQLVHCAGGVHSMAPPQSRLRVDQLVLQGDAIVRREGLGLMPHWLTNRRLEAHPGTLELCLPRWQGPALPVWLLYPHGSLSRRARAFLQHLRRSVPAAWARHQPVSPGMDGSVETPGGACCRREQDNPARDTTEA